MPHHACPAWDITKGSKALQLLGQRRGCDRLPLGSVSDGAGLASSATFPRDRLLPSSSFLCATLALPGSAWLEEGGGKEVLRGGPTCQWWGERKEAEGNGKAGGEVTLRTASLVLYSPSEIRNSAPRAAPRGHYSLFKPSITRTHAPREIRSMMMSVQQPKHPTVPSSRIQCDRRWAVTSLGPAPFRTPV